MTFASPLWLWALLALPLLPVCESWAHRQDRERVSLLVAVSLWPRVVVRAAPWWRGVRLGLILLGAAGLLVALARPQWGIVREKVEREGVDVVLALDTSGSMATEDVPPNRFFLAKAALLSLVARLEGDRFGLLAFEGEAYPLVPLTLDADAVGLFLETLDPGAVPAPGSSLGIGLSKGLDMFVDKGRLNKVLVLISDGEDLEGEVEGAVKKAKEAGVIVHTVGVGTEAGQPVPDFDREGKQLGFKKDDAGSAVVSRLHPETLEAIARGTGGRFFRVGGAETSLSGLASVIEGMEQKTVAREFTYRKKERYQAPLAVSLISLGLALILPFPDLRRRRDQTSGSAGKRPMLPRVAAVIALVLLVSPSARAADGGKPVDEVLLRPRRLTNEGRQAYDRGDHPASLQAFEKASAARPADPQTRFNLADALYKNGKYDEAAALYGALGQDAASPLAAAARYNLGNALFQKKDYPAAVRAYRDALRAAPGDADTRHNLEAALRALQQQEKEQKKQQDKKDDKDKEKDQKKDDQQQGKDKDSQKQDQKDDKSPGKDGPKPEPEKTPEQKENERFQKEAGMPKDRAMQLLDALQQNEKGEQKKILAAQRKKKKGGKDW